MNQLINMLITHVRAIILSVVLSGGMSLPLLAQMPQEWKGELELGLIQMIAGNDFVGFHGGGLWNGAKPMRWHRVSLDWFVQAYPLYYYQRFDSLALTQDSGSVQALSISYGREGRTQLGERVLLSFGVEIGVAYSRTNRTTRNWSSGNLADHPSVTRLREDNWVGMLSPYSGITVWLDQHLGLMGQLWFRSQISQIPGQARTSISFDSRLEGRVGVVYRLMASNG